MLNRDPKQRPNINQLLKYPVIADRIRKLLNENDFKDEFSHTILHNQNVFDEFRAIQAKKKADEEKARMDAAKAEEEAKKQKELEEQMAKMNVNNYKPKYGQDPQLFNQMYMNYIDQLNSADSNVDYSEPDTPATQYSSGSRPISQQSS